MFYIQIFLALIIKVLGKSRKSNIMYTNFFFRMARDVYDYIETN